MTKNGTGLEKTDWTDIFVLWNLPLGFLLLIYNETEKQHLWKPASLQKEAFLSKAHLALLALLLCSKIISGLGEKNSWNPQDVEAVSWCFIHFTHFSYKAQSQPLRAKISQVESKRDLCVLTATSPGKTRRKTTHPGPASTCWPQTGTHFHTLTLSIFIFRQLANPS